ncbi:hypothetical protein BCR32DRAFT_290970 [Anaeromyces robustus]|uniref:Uncharacterized protein n=1 Tax=Anaeromyces robustus TaxID=1754192 RepID=A0A1Y1XI20_9FUNG|nr:hypothetical protein BCR32DRAFT_290970 [Anaeromyces robustus]|eukprot:ORX85016.1 hypothetical protein BCR32DRAFT_290970 [Anaeromyces robustus]
MDYIKPSTLFQAIRLADCNVYPLNWKISFLTFLHAVNGAYIYRKNLLTQNVTRVPFIQGFVSYILMSLGGSLTAGLLIGIPPGWLINDNILPLYFVVYCIFFLDRNAYITKFISKGGIIIEYISAFINATSRTNTLAGLINMIRDYKDPYINNSIVLLLVCGTLSACGGGILDHTFNLSKLEWKYNTPSCLKGENSFSLKATTVATLFYIIVSNPMNNDMVGLFGFIIRLRRAIFGDFTRIQAMTLTWIFFLTIYFIYTYITSKKYSDVPFIPPSFVKIFNMNAMNAKNQEKKEKKEEKKEEKKTEDEKKNE